MTASPQDPLPITFLSDYGLQDEFVGVCHGVIAMRCPRARVIDLAHSIPPHDVLAGALLLRDSLPYMPAGVHIAVVDPGVGASGARARRAVALRTAQQQRLLVGPDNGLLAPAAARFGGVVEAVDIGDSSEGLRARSHTFHGRDLFAPVAAALAGGAGLRDVGTAISGASLAELEIPRASCRNGSLHARVLSVDRFGNLATDASCALMEQMWPAAGALITVAADGAEHNAVRAAAFADAPPGGLIVHCDSRGALALAVNLGSAAALLRAGPGTELVLTGA